MLILDDDFGKVTEIVGRSSCSNPTLERCKGSRFRKAIQLSDTIMVYSTGWKRLQHKLWNGNPLHEVNLYWLRKVGINRTGYEIWKIPKRAKLFFQADWVYEEPLNMWRMWNWVRTMALLAQCSQVKKDLSSPVSFPPPGLKHSEWVRHYWEMKPLLENSIHPFTGNRHGGCMGGGGPRGKKLNWKSDLGLSDYALN